jgi:hypothetical protein
MKKYKSYFQERKSSEEYIKIIIEMITSWKNLDVSISTGNYTDIGQSSLVTLKKCTIDTGLSGTSVVYRNSKAFGSFRMEQIINYYAPRGFHPDDVKYIDSIGFTIKMDSGDTSTIMFYK